MDSPTEPVRSTNADLSQMEDPTKDSILEQVMRESKRRQNDIMEEKRQQEALEKAQKDRE